jgi:hypothetical protein
VGWAAHTDPASGKTFYAHAATGTSQWEFPAAPALAPAPAPAPAAASASAKVRKRAPPSSASRLGFPTHVPQAAAAARVAGKSDIVTAARDGDISLVSDHIAADSSSVHKKSFL